MAAHSATPFTPAQEGRIREIVAEETHRAPINEAGGERPGLIERFYDLTDQVKELRRRRWRHQGGATSDL